MKVALTGATGFLGRYLVWHLLEQGHHCRCWHRVGSDRTGIPETRTLEWVEGELNDPNSTRALIDGCDAVIHAALFRPGHGFRGAEGDLVEFLEANLIGTIRLIEQAWSEGVSRFVFVSTCAVHERILDDRALDEAHPLWPLSHYGAHKAAIEKFVHSYGYGRQFPICALRPTGIYGCAHPIEDSKWFDLVKDVVEGRMVECRRGGKEVHVSDVAKAALLLMEAADIEGHAFNCYDRYVSEYEVASIAKEISGSDSQIHGEAPQPKHQIETDRLRHLGMSFGGSDLLYATVQQMVQAVQNSDVN